MNHKEIERWYRLRNIVKACKVLVVVSVALCLIWLVVPGFPKPKPDFSRPDPTAGMRIEHFSYSAPGPRPWELRADAAVVSQSLDRVQLTRPTVLYPVGAGREFVLKAKTGELDKNSQQVTARGDVSVKYGDFLFKTDELRYSGKTKTAETSSLVTLNGPDLHATGKGLTCPIDENEIVIHQDVRCTIFNVKWMGSGGGLPF
ncbi:MAG: LPS export ABC transporter periplasmic protein LptC [Desulfomonile tiedjei]|nr:LPS export ABC transporter periplasmic protein LptC [Desulfomonile tiedjei]